jgi:hypothetical protein
LQQNQADNSIFLLRASDGVSSCLHRASRERAEETCGGVVAGPAGSARHQKHFMVTGCDGF